MTASRARSPLELRAEDLRSAGRITGGDIEIAEVPFLGQVDVRVDPGLAESLGFPMEPNTVVDAGGRSVLWLGPDEWLVVGGTFGGADMTAELEAALAGAHHSVIDVSANRAIIELRGPKRHDLLAKGCSLDLDPRSWSPGGCAQTLLARTQVLLHESSGSTRVFVRPSYSAYLVDWLLEAAREFGP